MRLWRYLEDGGKRAVAIWHRRAGKDDIGLHWAAVAAHQRRGNYWHMLPEASQARKAIWEAINPHSGMRRVDEAFPPELRETARENEMSIRFKCGSQWQVVGSDNYNSLIGSPPVGIVFSEWAVADPASWSFLRPILAENKGWAVWITTPRGHNHAKTFYDAAKADRSWFAQLLSAEDTNVFTPATLRTEREELVREYGPDEGDARFRQEYLCSFEAGVIGAYFGREMEAAEKEGRIGGVPVDIRLPVHTAWDIGIGDSTAIWCVQLVGREVHAVDYIENSGVDVGWYVRELDRRPWKWGEHVLPHDADHAELGTGKSICRLVEDLGLRRVRTLPRETSITPGINDARALIGQTWFDREKCARGIAALQNYRRAWNEKLRAYADRPLHDWASHGADAWRYLARAEVRNPGPVKKLAYRNLGLA